MEHERKSILESAARLWEEDPETLTRQAICDGAGVPAEVFDDLFEGVDDVVDEWYVDAADRAGDLAAALPNYADMRLEERLGAFCFVLLDVLEERLSFVSASFGEHAAGFGSPFHHRLRDVLGDVLDAADIPTVNRLVVDTVATRFVLAESIVQMVRQWLSDDSADRGRSTALIDKVIALLSDMLTNRVPQRTVDLVRYCAEAGYLPVENIPIVRDWFRREEADA